MSTGDAYAAARAAVTEMFGLVESDDQTCCFAHVLQFARDGKPGRTKFLLVSKLTSFNLQQTPTGFTFEAYLEHDHFPEAFPRFIDLIVSPTSGAFDCVVRQVKLERSLISVDLADLIAIYGPFRLHLSKPDRMLYVADEEVISPRGEEMVRELVRGVLSPVELSATGLTMADVGLGMHRTRSHHHHRWTPARRPSGGGGGSDVRPSHASQERVGPDPSWPR